MDNEDRYITIVDDDQKEHLAEVLFTFVDERQENYVLLTMVDEFDQIDDLTDEYDVLAYKYEELSDGTIGNLIEIPEGDKEAWNTVEEMFEAFNDSNLEV